MKHSTATGEDKKAWVQGSGIAAGVFMTWKCENKLMDKDMPDNCYKHENCFGKKVSLTKLNTKSKY